ncbi:MAG: hypothetical protein WBF52_02475, partial [Geitlerinemataceae cyanobacterium]
MSSVTNVPGIKPGYDFLPLLTVGQEVPQIQGSIGNFSPTGTTFALTGIPDGMGLYETPTHNYLFVNHEFGSTVVSDISSCQRTSVFCFPISGNPLRQNHSLRFGRFRRRRTVYV